MANITLTRHDIVDHTDAALINGPEGKDLAMLLLRLGRGRLGH